MSGNTGDKGRRFDWFLLFWLCLTAATVLTTTFYSSQPADVSTESSDEVIYFLLGFPLPSFIPTDNWLALAFLVRKTAHFTLYFIQGLGLFGSLKRQRRIPALPGAIFCSMVFATLDELHQYFVPGRSCKITDVLLDTCGAALASLLFYAFCRWRDHRQAFQKAE